MSLLNAELGVVDILDRAEAMRQIEDIEAIMDFGEQRDRVYCAGVT
jgi:hypothetical protein